MRLYVKKTKNIQGVKETLWIDFTHNGERYRKPLKLDNTPANKRIAKNHMIPAIQHKISTGEFFKNKMKTVDALQEPSTGLELDKFSLSDFMHTPESGKRARKGEKGLESKRSAVYVSNFTIALIVGGIILSLAFVYLLWDQSIIKMPFIESMPHQKMSERIVTVGPIMASLGKDEHMKMTVQIECKNPKVKDTVSNMQNLIQSKIMLLLNNPASNLL